MTCILFLMIDGNPGNPKVTGSFHLLAQKNKTLRLMFILLASLNRTRMQSQAFAYYSKHPRFCIMKFLKLECQTFRKISESWYGISKVQILD